MKIPNQYNRLLHQYLHFLGWAALARMLSIPCLIPALIVLFAPLNVLDQLPWLRPFTQWMTAHVPYMDGHANSTIYPQMALLVNCLAVALVPYVAVIVICQTWLNYSRLLLRWTVLQDAKLRQHFILLIGPFFFVGLMASMVMLAGDPSWASGTSTHRRGLFYAFSVFFLPLVTGAVIGGQILNIRFFIDTYLRKGASNE